ncbi:hypothetical protein ACFS32_21665 [Novosphingobium pokkalii]|uniref:hypothetical protein n=1 Tax=Novosphingobium pokkalii TaxID=1770194 RepID=UPI0036325548
MLKATLEIVLFLLSGIAMAAAKVAALAALALAVPVAGCCSGAGGGSRGLGDLELAAVIQALPRRLECDDKKWEPVFVKNRTTTNIWSVRAFHRNVITL